eukprot:403332423
MKKQVRSIRNETTLLLFNFLTNSFRSQVHQNQKTDIDLIANTSAKLVQKVTGHKEKKKSIDMSVDIGMPQDEHKMQGAGAGKNNQTNGQNNSVSAGINGEKSVEDSFERYYNKDLDLDEDQVPIVIYELNESAINFISQESYEKALILLQKAQTMLDQIQADQNPKDQLIFLLTIHNMALCYQKLGILEECAVCLETCLQTLQQPYIQLYFNNPAVPALRLKLLKYKFKDMIEMAQIYNNELLQRRPLDEISIINNPKFSLLEKTSVKLLPILKELRRRMAYEDQDQQSAGSPQNNSRQQTQSEKRRKSVGSNQNSNIPSVKPQSTQNKNSNNGLNRNSLLNNDHQQENESPMDIDMKNLLGYLNQSEWIYSLNIGNIMQIAPLTMQDFLSSSALEMELSREYVLEKFCFLAVSYFCMGTEFRFLHQLQEMLGEQIYSRRDSEYWHGKAVEIAISFLPSESPLVSHILMSYEKHHSPSNQSIPEDEHQDIQVKVVRQVKGIDSNKLQPIIRHHNDKDFKVAYIDIEPMNYQDILFRPFNNQMMRQFSQIKQIFQQTNTHLSSGENINDSQLLELYNQVNSSSLQAHPETQQNVVVNTSKLKPQQSKQNQNQKQLVDMIQQQQQDSDGEDVEDLRNNQQMLLMQQLQQQNFQSNSQDDDEDNSQEGNDSDDITVQNTGQNIEEVHDQDSLIKIRPNSHMNQRKQSKSQNKYYAETDQKQDVIQDASQGVKNLRKLKKTSIQQNNQQMSLIDQDQYAHSQQFLENDSSHNLIIDRSSSQNLDERPRAKSSLEQNSATRLRTKIVGAQKLQQTNINVQVNNNNNQLMMQQLRGNSSSAMARLHATAQNNNGLQMTQQQQYSNNVLMQQQQQMQTISQNPSSVLRNITSVSSGIDENIQGKNQILKTKSNLDSQIVNNDDIVDLDQQNSNKARIMRAQMLQGGSGNPKRRFKNGQQQQMNGQNINQDLSSITIEAQQQVGNQKNRNEKRRQNSTSREKATPNRQNIGPITDIRQKKSQTINVDDLPSESQGPIMKNKLVDPLIGTTQLSHLQQLASIQHHQSQQRQNTSQRMRQQQNQSAQRQNLNNSAILTSAQQDQLDIINSSLERDASRLNQSVISNNLQNISLNNSLITHQPSIGGLQNGVQGKSQRKKVGNTIGQQQQMHNLQNQSMLNQQVKGRTPTENTKQKFMQYQQMQSQLMNFVGQGPLNQQLPAPDGLMSMIKKREKLNNSALGTTTAKSGPGMGLSQVELGGGLVGMGNQSQLITQINKLYSQKRTPTANAGPFVQQIQQQANSANMSVKMSSGSKSKDRQPPANSGMKLASFTQDNWNTSSNGVSNGLEITKLLDNTGSKKPANSSGQTRKAHRVG